MGYGHSLQSRASSLTSQFMALPNQTKLTIAAAAIAIPAAAAYMFWPDRHETLAEWDPNYMDYCYSAAVDSEFGGYSRVRGRVNDTLTTLQRVGPVGWRASERVIGNDRVICYGEPYSEDSGDIHFNRWIGTYFVEWDISDRAVTEYLFDREVRDYVGEVIFRENEYITPHAVLWSRAQVASLQAVIADALYYFYREPGYGEPEPFDTQSWQDFENNPQTRAAALAFRGVMEAQDYPDIRDARLAAFQAALSDHDAIYESDYHFLSWYKDEVDEEAVDVPYSCGPNGEDTCYRTEYEDPSWWVHSEEIHPDTLVALSYAFFPQDGFIDIEDSYDILNNPENWRPTTTRTQNMFNAAVRNADRHCRGHYSEGDMSLGTGMNMDMLPENNRFRPEHNLD